MNTGPQQPDAAQREWVEQQMQRWFKTPPEELAAIIETLRDIAAGKRPGGLKYTAEYARRELPRLEMMHTLLKARAMHDELLALIDDPIPHADPGKLTRCLELADQTVDELLGLPGPLRDGLLQVVLPTRQYLQQIKDNPDTATDELTNHAHRKVAEALKACKTCIEERTADGRQHCLRLIDEAAEAFAALPEETRHAFLPHLFDMRSRLESGSD